MGRSAHSLSSQETLVSPHEKDSYVAFDTTDRLEVLRGLMKDEGVSMTCGNRFSAAADGPRHLARRIPDSLSGRTQSRIRRS